MTQPVIEPRSPGPLANTLLIRRMTRPGSEMGYRRKK